MGFCNDIDERAVIGMSGGTDVEMSKAAKHLNGTRTTWMQDEVWGTHGPVSLFCTQATLGASMRVMHGNGCDHDLLRDPVNIICMSIPFLPRLPCYLKKMCDVREC